MKYETKKALEQFSKFLANVESGPDVGDISNFSTPDAVAERIAYARARKSSKTESSKGITRAIMAGNPYAAQVATTTSDEIAKGVMDEIIKNLDSSVGFTSRQFLCPQGVHQPIVAFEIAAAATIDTAQVASEVMEKTEEAITNAGASGADATDLKDVTTGDWADWTQRVRDAIDAGLVSELSSLVGGFKMVNHELWKANMNELGALKILPESFMLSSHKHPTKAHPSYGYVAFVDPMQSYSRVESELCGVGNTLIPSLEWSRAVPYFNITVSTNFHMEVTDSTDPTMRNQMSLENFLSSGLTSPIGGYTGQRTIKIEEKPVMAINPDGSEIPLVIEDQEVMEAIGRTQVGMEAFTTPQSIVPAGQPNEAWQVDGYGYSSIDRMRPFMTIENLAVAVTPTRGALSSMRATLVLTLHDRGRLPQVGALLKPETLSKTEFDIEWGWSHPAKVPNGNALTRGYDSNIYGQFINSLRQRQTFNLYQSSYAFTDDGQVQITLQMVGKGVESLNEKDAGTTGALVQSRDAIQVAFAALEAAKNKYDDSIGSYTSGIADLDGEQILNTIGINNVGALIHADNQTAIEEWISTAQAQKLPELDSLIDAVTTLKKSVSAADKSLRGELEKKINIMSNSRYKDWETYTRGSVGEKCGWLYGDNNPKLGRVGKAEWQSKRGKYIPLGAFVQMFAAQPLMTTGLYDEVQVVTYTANLNAGAAAGANLGALPIDIGDLGGKSFLDLLDEEYKNYGGQYPITRFMDWLVGNFVEPQLSACHGFGSGNASFTYDNNKKQIVAKETPTKNLVKTATDTLRKMYYGDAAEGNGDRPTPFSPVKIKLMFEVATSSAEEMYRQGYNPTPSAVSGKTIMRIHVLDAVAEGAESMGWIDVLKQGRKTTGGMIVPPQVRSTPGMSSITRIACNWSQNQMTTSKVCSWLVDKNILNPVELFDESATSALEEEEKVRLEKELTIVQDELARLNATGGTRDESTGRSVDDLNARITQVQSMLDGKGADVVVGYNLKSGASKRLIKLCSSMAPNIVYGREASLVTSMQIKQRTNSKASTVYMLRALDSQGGATSEGNRGVPMRLQSADVNIETFGNPSFKFMQRFFVDADTGTSIDNLYAVSGLEHTLSKTEFKTSLKLVPLEAYGVFTNMSTELDRVTASLRSLKSARARKAADDRRDAAAARGRAYGAARPEFAAGVQNFRHFVDAMASIVGRAAPWISFANLRAVNIWGELLRYVDDLHFGPVDFGAGGETGNNINYEWGANARAYSNLAETLNESSRGWEFDTAIGGTIHTGYEGFQAKALTNHNVISNYLSWVNAHSSVSMGPPVPALFADVPDDGNPEIRFSNSTGAAIYKGDQESYINSRSEFLALKYAYDWFYKKYAYQAYMDVINYVRGNPSLLTGGGTTISPQGAVGIFNSMLQVCGNEGVIPIWSRNAPIASSKVFQPLIPTAGNIEGSVLQSTRASNAKPDDFPGGRRAFGNQSWGVFGSSTSRVTFSASGAKQLAITNYTSTSGRSGGYEFAGMGWNRRGGVCAIQGHGAPAAPPRGQGYGAVDSEYQGAGHAVLGTGIVAIADVPGLQDSYRGYVGSVTHTTSGPNDSSLILESVEVDGTTTEGLQAIGQLLIPALYSELSEEASASEDRLKARDDEVLQDLRDNGAKAEIEGVDTDE